MSKWISVKDRLPVRKEYEFVSYLVYSPRLGVRIENQHPSWWNYRDKRGKEFHGPRVTHWQNLPKAPKASQFQPSLVGRDNQ